MHVLSADSIVGTRVQNMDSEDIGTIKAVMIDLAHGRIAYAVLDFGGFFGIGNKLFALPWSGFKINTEREVIMLDVDKEKLENASGFDKDNWPDMSNMDFATEIYSYYGNDPYWKSTV